MIASDNDPHVTPKRAREISNHWGASFLLLRSAGHINSESGFGEWSEGISLLRAIFDLNDASSSVASPTVDDRDDSAWICRGID